MKKVEATIAPYTLDTVRESLVARGVDGLSVCEVREGGYEAVRVDYYRGTAYEVDLHPKIKLEIVVCDEDAAATAYAIIDAARTGRAGGGYVTISPVEDAVRIRTGEHGPAAIRRPVDSLVETRWAAHGRSSSIAASMSWIVHTHAVAIRRASTMYMIVPSDRSAAPTGALPPSRHRAEGSADGLPGSLHTSTIAPALPAARLLLNSPAGGRP
jgi:nitrogen regulatory protein P-II 1